MLGYGKQSISEADIEAVTRVLRSDFLTQGPAVEEFEKNFAEMCGAKHAIAVSSGTAALHLAMMIGGVGPGDRVTTTPITFVASANCGRMVGADVDFVDVDPDSACLSPDELESNWQEGTKAVVAVDYAGQPAELPRIAEIARSRNALVIEDACHAVGGEFFAEGASHRVGGHPFADMTAFSFHPVKTMTCGEGGMLTLERDDWAEHARELRTHGITRDAGKWTGELSPAPGQNAPWYYEMQHLANNYRLSDLQAALGNSQLGRLPEFVERRREIFDAYNSAFEDISWLQTPRSAAWLGEKHQISWHLYAPQFDFEALGQTRAEIMAHLRENGVGTQVHYIPVHKQPCYDTGQTLPVAEAFYQRTLSLPLFPAMTDHDVQHVIKTVQNLG